MYYILNGTGQKEYTFVTRLNYQGKTRMCTWSLGVNHKKNYSNLVLAVNAPLPHMLTIPAKHPGCLFYFPWL